MNYTLSKHLNIKRIEFGDKLYKCKLLSSILHTCAIWSPSDTYEKKLESIQYNAGRAIFCLKNTPAYEGLISDLGWSPIKYVLYERQIKYLLYLKQNCNNSLNGYLLHSMEERMNKGLRNAWNYVERMNKILCDLGYSGIHETSETICDSLYKYLQEKSEMYTLNHIENRSTLELFDKFKLFYPRGRAPYLNNDFNFQYARATLLARVGRFNLQYEKSKWNDINSPNCPWCPTEIETLEHRILECQNFERQRTSFFDEIKSNFPSELYQSFFHSEKLRFIIGNESDIKWGQDWSKLFNIVRGRFLQNIYSTTFSKS